MSPLEEKAVKTFHHMWDTWDNPTKESISESISTWAEDCKGFGSSLTEVWRNRNDFKKFCEQGLLQSPNGFSYHTKWLETHLLDDNLVALWGEIIITVKLPIKNVVIDPVRVTGVFKNIGEEMKLVQWHSSEPDVSTVEELWPGTGEPKYYEEVSILFTDFVGFTNAVSTIPPKKLIMELNEIFAEFDTITGRHDLDKVKTIGDAYMAVGGLNDQKDHAVASIKTAKDMLKYLDQRNKKSALKWEMRIGIHCGPAVGGVIGSQKLSFDLWGDTVNVASRIENSGSVNKINISAYTYDLVEQVFPCEYRGKIETKDRGKIDMYFVK